MKFKNAHEKFMWFIGIYEGEGTLKVDETNIRLVINMTDLDVIEECSKFLGTKVRKIPMYNKDGTLKPHMIKKDGTPFKQKYEVTKKGGVIKGGKLLNLFSDMKPYLSKRRLEQLDAKIKQAKSNSKNKNLLK